jgi:hypothetical protein
VRDVRANFTGGISIAVECAAPAQRGRAETANHATIASIRARSGLLLLDQLLAKTDAMHRETLEVLQRVLGPEYPDTLKTVKANRPRHVRWRRGDAP